MLCSQKDTLRKSFFLLTKRLLTKRVLTSIQHKILWKPSKNWDKTLKNFLHFLNYALQDAKAVKNTWEKDTSVQKNHRKRHFCFYQIKISHFCPSKDTSVYQKSLLSIESHFCSYRIIFHLKTKIAVEKDTSVLPKVTSVLKMSSETTFQKPSECFIRMSGWDVGLEGSNV